LPCKGGHFSEVVKDVLACRDVLKRDGRCFILFALQWTIVPVSVTVQGDAANVVVDICEAHEPRLPETNTDAAHNIAEMIISQIAAYNQRNILLQSAVV